MFIILEDYTDDGDYEGEGESQNKQKMVRIHKLKINR